MKKPVTNARVTRWLLLQEFDVTIIDKPRKENVVAYFVSQLSNNDDDTPVEDYFPVEHLFSVSTFSQWYADIASYLVAGRFPLHLSKQEKNYIAKCKVLRDQRPSLLHRT